MFSYIGLRGGFSKSGKVDSMMLEFKFTKFYNLCDRDRDYSIYSGHSKIRKKALANSNFLCLVELSKLIAFAGETLYIQFCILRIATIDEFNF